MRDRLLVAVLVVSLALPAIHIAAAVEFLHEAPLPEMVSWDPLPVLPPDPFAWPPPAQPSLLDYLPRKNEQSKPFPAFLDVATNILLPPSPDEAAPWTPADLAPIAPPDGMPVHGSPAGLAMFENSVGNGIILGEVSDATTLNPISGALVEITGSGRMAETDAQGRFLLGGLAPGTYNIEASQLGYFGDTTVITVIGASPSEVRFGLRVKPTDDTANEFTMEEETVVGEYNGDSAGDLFLELNAAPSVVAGIGKDDFTASGISDAGDAVSKISGANIVGGKYAVVRGLGDRYSNTTVNGALISSADPSKKAVQLDLFPSDLLESIKIYKIFTPNLPGEFAGGLVAIDTLSFPEESFAEVEFGYGSNSNLSGSDFWTVPGRDLGFLGKPNDALPAEARTLETGGLPRGISSTRPPNLSNPAQAAIAQEAVDAWSALHSSSGMRPVRESPEPAQDLSVAFGNTYDFKNGIELGVVLSGVWSRSNQVREGVQVGRQFTPGSDLIAGTPDDGVNRSQMEDRYTASAGYGLLGSFGLRLGDRHEIGYTYFQNHRAEDEVTRGTKVLENGVGFREFLSSGDNPFGAGAYTYQAFDSINPVQRTLTLNQLTGSHEFGDEDNPIVIEWLLSRSGAVEDRPQSSTLYFSELDFTDARIQSEQGDVYDPSLGIVYTLPDVYGNTPAIVESYRESLKTVETAGNEKIDITVPLWSDGDDFIKISAGGSHFDRSREVRGRLFTYSLGGGLNDELINRDNGEYGVDYLNNFDSIFEPDGSLKFDGWSGSQPRSDKIIISEASLGGRTVRNVDASTDLNATYLMTTASIGKWDVIGGFRFEEETRQYQVLPGLNPTFSVNPSPVAETSSYLLPGILITRDFGDEDEFTLTYAWSKTVARPTFYEFAPVITEDQASGDEIEGNPNLKDTLITNIDLNTTWRPRKGTSIGASLFYKSMQDPIAQAYTLNRKTWINGESGTLKGIELEVSQDVTEHWSVSSNFTFIDSSLVYIQRQGAVQSTINSGFEGQPEYIFNFNLGYDNKETGWSGNLVYNFTGSYLTGVPLSDVDPPVRREAFDQLDFILQKRFDLWNGTGALKFKCGNLLDSTERQVFDGTDQVYQSYEPGRSYSLSFKYEF